MYIPAQHDDAKGRHALFESPVVEMADNVIDVSPFPILCPCFNCFVHVLIIFSSIRVCSIPCFLCGIRYVFETKAARLHVSTPEEHAFLSPRSIWSKLPTLLLFA